ncbi:MAG TPA: hypothetical protein VGK27_00750 [Candidatus Deferrimicrobiaceae bacterium]|jgi:hypothetical protein
MGAALDSGEIIVMASGTPVQDPAMVSSNAFMAGVGGMGMHYPSEVPCLEMVGHPGRHHGNRRFQRLEFAQKQLSGNCLDHAFGNRAFYPASRAGNAPKNVL